MNADRIVNLEAERYVLGAVICNNDLMCEVDLSPDDFYEPIHSAVYKVMQELYKNNKSIDLVTLAESMRNTLKEKGGVTYLGQLIESSGYVRHIKSHVDIVKEKSKMRLLRKTLLQSLEDIDKSDKPSGEIAQSITDRTFENRTVEMIDDNKLMKYTLDIIDANFNQGGRILGIETGLSDLDKALNGLQKKKLYIAAGRPGMGKSAFAINVQQNISNKRIAYFSLEMAAEELGLRRLAMTSNIDSTNLERGNMSQEEWNKVIECCARISRGNCLTNTKPGITLYEIRQICKKMQLQGGIDCLIIDHIGILNLKDIGDNIREKTTNACIELKNIAKEFGIPVLALCQLSRACETRQNKRPVLSDLKESGGIEENADVVLFFYRDEYYNKETEEKNVVEVNIAKQRGGRTGTIKLFWWPQYQKLANYTKKGASSK